MNVINLLRVAGHTLEFLYLHSKKRPGAAYLYHCMMNRIAIFIMQWFKQLQLGMYLDQGDLCTCAVAKELPVNNIHMMIVCSAWGDAQLVWRDRLNKVPRIPLTYTYSPAKMAARSRLGWDISVIVLCTCTHNYIARKQVTLSPHVPATQNYTCAGNIIYVCTAYRASVLKNDFAIRAYKTLVSYIS